MVSLPTTIDETSELLERGNYLAQRNLATVLFLALKLNRPLFLEGEAGVGKTEIAKVLASTLGRKLIRLQCYEGLDVAQAVYEWNYSRQMIEIRLAEASGDTDRTTLAGDIFSERFLITRPLLEALEPHVEGPPVLLIDELDRTDEPFEAYLLEVLSDYQGDHPRDRDGQGRAAANRGDYLQPHARNPRRAETALSLSLGRLPRPRAGVEHHPAQGAADRRQAGG